MRSICFWAVLNEEYGPLKAQSVAKLFRQRVWSFFNSVFCVAGCLL